jgi:hypothetical protein
MRNIAREISFFAFALKAQFVGARLSVKGNGQTCLALNALLEAMDVPSSGVDELAANQSASVKTKNSAD